MITDEDDTDSSGDPEDWYRKLGWVRAGSPPNWNGNVDLHDVAFLALVANNLSCAPETSERIHEFLNLTPRHYAGDVCNSSYTEFFDDAVGVVSNHCGIVHDPEG